VGTATLGIGFWGQLDLAGNMAQWSLDSVVGDGPTYLTPCANCANFASTPYRMVQGSDFMTSNVNVLSPTYQSNDSATARSYTTGIRCGRAP